MASNIPEHHYQGNYGSPLFGQQKVAIPRLQRVEQRQSGLKDRRRVPRACTGCRSHKIKCTGEKPRCKHCATTNRECVYILPRKDRLKIVTEQCHQLTDFLTQLRDRVSTEDGERIADILEDMDEDLSEQRRTPTPIPSQPDVDSHGSQGSGEASGFEHFEHLDTEALDLLDEDLHSSDGARSTGFVGKSSEVQWLRTVALAQQERPDGEWSGSRSQRRPSNVLSNEQVSSFSFWADCDDVSVNFYVDPYELPRPDFAEHLVQCYMLRVHDSFPILPRNFVKQTRVYFAALREGKAPRLNPKWQAILNLVFAIGANYSYLYNKDWPEGDANLFHARARAFGLNEASLTTHSDVPQIQGLGLLAFYWLSVGQVSRAWTLVGVALRSAYSLGLHVRNEDPSANASKRETLVQTWWSLYSLERILSIITGRPSIIVDSCCSVPLPMTNPGEEPLGEAETTHGMRTVIASLSDSPTFSASSNIAANPPHMAIGSRATDVNSGSYFRAVVQLSIISQNILTSLYSAGTMIRSPSEIQQDTHLLSQRLDQWSSSLPPEFRSHEGLREPHDVFARERVLLRFQLCTARILLTRPCLTARRQPWKDAGDANFSRRMADSCIEAARTIVASLPEEYNPQMYEQCPWWCLVHHMMQAISVCLLGLSYPASTSCEPKMMIHCTRKAIRWLQMMKGPVAERAHRVAIGCFEDLARRYDVDISDLWKRKEPSVVRSSTSNSRAGPSPNSSAQSDTMGQASGSIPGPYVQAGYGSSGAQGISFHPEASMFDDSHLMMR